MFVYADQDRLVEHGLKLVIEKLLSVIKILEDNGLDHLLNTGHLEKIWQKDVLTMQRDLTEWETN